MKGYWRSVTVWGLALLAAVSVAGVIVHIFAGRSADELEHRATVWGTVLAALLVVPTVLGWAWAHRRPPVAAPSATDQAVAAAEVLATRTFASWSQQADALGIQNQGVGLSVRVRWEWAGPDLGVSREEVNVASASGADPMPLPGTEAGEVLGSGLVTRLHDRVYARLRPGRLVLIGGPGTGKTGAMILLLLAALRHRRQVPEADRAEVPVPVWLTLGSWNPYTQTLREWVSETATRDHPYLKAAAFGPDVVEVLFDTARIALFLDGLDEMPEAARVHALARLRAETAGLRVVLTSRPEEYRAALDTSGQSLVGAVLDLQPVGAPAAVDYLLAGRVGAARQAWTRLTDQLTADPDGVLARALNSPLTLSLARTAYPADPTPLLDPTLNTLDALHHHLLDHTLANAYPDERERACATYWLARIAHCMNTHPTGPTRDLAWWHIPTWTPRWKRSLAAGTLSGLVAWAASGLMGGLVAGLVIGLSSWLVAGVAYGFGVGLMAGLGVGLGIGLRDKRAVIPPGMLAVHRFSPQELWSGLRPGVVAGLVAGVAYGLLGWLAYGLGLMGGLATGVVAGVAFGLAVGLGVGFMKASSAPSADSAEATARSTHRQDARFGLVFGFVGGLVALVLGPLGGFVGGLVLGLVGNATTGLLLVETLSAAAGRRVRFMRLLEKAADQQVLRRAGTVYQFRHAELQDRLATRYATGTLHPPRPDPNSPDKPDSAPSTCT